MEQSVKYRWIFFSSICLLLLLVVWHVFAASTQGSFLDLWNSIFHFSENNINEVVFREIRIPRTVMALVAGVALSISGLLLQNLFSNPLAGPSSLGISSGASLSVAFFLMFASSSLHANTSIIFVSFLGALLFSVLILVISFWIKSQVSLLLIGLMLSSFTSAIIQILQAYSDTNQLKLFTLWGQGSLQMLNYNQIFAVSSFLILGLFFLLFLIKPLNVFVLGEAQAQALGVNTSIFRIGCVAISSLLLGLVTAFCGPIAFIGLAVPNVVKILFKTQNHLVLLSACALIGAIVVLLCDLVVYVCEPYFLLPLNSVTALVGAPVVIYVIVKSRLK